MMAKLKLPASVGLWRGVAILLLSAGLAGAQTALADVPPTAAITVYVPGATVGAPVSVQRQVGSRWIPVAAWQGNLYDATYTGVLYLSFTVDPSDYGQGPYRWVIYGVARQNIFAISEAFFLPETGGINLSEIVGPPDARVGTAPQGFLAGEAVPVPAVQAPVLNVTRSDTSTYCRQNCNTAEISTYVTGLSSFSWIAVEWQNEQGYWQPVLNWERTAYRMLPPMELMYVHWTVLPEIYGHGPFRWAFYASPNGGILGVSPSFNLPTSSGINSVQYLSP